MYTDIQADVALLRVRVITTSPTMYVYIRLEVC